jgi:hypothetical protein
MVDWLRGGRSAVVDGDLHGRRRRCGELTRPTSMTDGSSSNSMLEEEATMTRLSPNLDGDGRGSAVGSHGELEGNDGMALFFIEVLTEQRVRLACQAAHRVVAIAHDQRGQLSGVGN